MTRSLRRLAVACTVALTLVASVLVGLRIAASQLQAQLLLALGPRASVARVDAGWRGIELQELRIRAAPGWPTEDELRATRVRVLPDLRSLLGRPWRVASVEVEGGFLSMLRTRDGHLRVLPALLDERRAAPAAPAGASAGGPLVEIGQVRLHDTTLAFYDGSVRQPAHAMRLEKLEAEAGPFVLPALDRAIALDIDAVFVGPQRSGKLSLAGKVTPFTGDASLHARLRGVDLLALQPYLVQVAEAGIRRGTLDLDVRAEVQHKRLHAPGQLTLTGLELNSSGGVLGTFAGVPRKAVLAAMSDKGRIDVRFTLDGRLDDPSFSLNENFATRVASGLSESLGVSLGGVVHGVEGVVKGLLGR
jgi:hypothetical protein